MATLSPQSGTLERPADPKGAFAYGALLVFAFLYFARPEDFILGLGVIPVAKITGGLALIGLIASSPEAANAYGFTILFPLTFISSAFVPVASMPDWLQWFAEHNPITTFVDTIRVLFIDAHADNAVWLSFVWVVVITLVFGMLSVWRFRRALSR